MSTADISEGKLEVVARYLDKFPPLGRGQEEEDVEQFWVLLVKELGRLPGPLGKKFSYSRSQLAQFGTAIEKDTSPSIDVLHDLQRKGLPFNVFIKCLESIHCQGALNVFLAATTPEITRQPQAQVLRVGEQLELSCEATCQPGLPQFFWFRYREREWEPLTDSNTNRLTIPDVNLDHSGTYACRAINPHINDVKKALKFSNHVEVTVENKDIQQITPIRQEEGNVNHPPSFPPVLTSHPLSIEVEQGDRAVLRCQAAGKNLVYDWYRDGAVFRDSNESGELVIEKAELKHAGSYHCNVVNIHGGKIQSHTATITVVPQIVIDKPPPKQLKVEYGEKVVLECRARCRKGKPLSYEWLKNKKSIPGARGSVLNISSDNLSFFDRVRCRVCLAADSSISVLSSATDVTIYHVRITRQPSDTQGYIGDCAELVCEAVNLSAPLDQKIDFLWLKSDSRGGKKEPLSGIPFKQDGGRLIFESLQLLHRGYYYCQPSPTRGNFLISQEVVVKVDMPEDSQIRITRGPVSWVVSEGGSFRMLCQAEASPQDSLTYQWYFNSQLIPEATEHTFEKREVKLTDYGPYYCVVRSSNDPSQYVDSDSVHVTEPHCESQRDKTPPTTPEQWEAERYQWTRDKRRYAREKVALLIGNQNYRNMATLKQTESEIENLAKTLTDINYKVFSFLDLTLVEMHNAFTWFCSLLSPGVYGFFYYCGHGFSQNHTCYLMPVDTPEGSPNQQQCLASDLIAKKMQATRCRAVMMLDCCQTFNESDVSLLASTPQTSLHMSNILEIYSCPSGRQAYEGSPFNKCVIQAIKDGVILRDMQQKVVDGMRQYITRPWYSGSMMDSQIAFHDEIMRDDLRSEEELEKIWEQRQLTHTTGLPPKITLESSQLLPKLHEVVAVTIECRALFTNILSLFVSLKPKKEDTIVSLGLSKNSMQHHGVTLELVPDKMAPYEIRVAGIQRLRNHLSIILCLSATVSGHSMEETVTHTLPPLHLPAIMSTNK